LAVALAACGSPVSSPKPSTNGPQVGPTPVIADFELGTTVWIDGFVVTIHSAIASLDAKGGPVSVLIRIENPGTEAATLDAPIRLTASGAAFELSHGTVLPEIPAGSGAELTLEFEVVGRPTIADGVLRIGRTEDHQIQVPFGPGPVALLTLEPLAANVDGTATAGGLEVALRRGVVRWDLPDWHTELPNATQALTVTYDATFSGDFAGGFAFTADSVGLRLPDGTIVAPRQDGHSQSIELIAPQQTLRGLESRFEIPTGLLGPFALVIRDGSTEQAIEFTIGP
ncbi:MAG TPA: hypothetical protein VKC59_06400, partial [Candidatus Limnocylindrales bacterium]|nr:hypothetical protein [Candidatus Limnocylindrales bacterium]